MGFYGERALYRRTCDKSGKEVISVYSPNKPYPVYAPELWWSDDWDPLAYGREFDFSRPFFEQFAELSSEVPKPALSQDRCENCAYNNNIVDCKNCYLLFCCAACEDSFYSSGSISVRDSLDVWWSKDIELSAYIFCSNTLYNCLYCDHCSSSNDLLFCRHMNNCNNCFGCANLSHAEYCIFNVQYTEEEYHAHIKRFNRGSHAQIQKLHQQVREYFLSCPYPAVDTDSNENSTGDFLYNSKNCEQCFTVVDCLDCRFLSDCGRNTLCEDMNNVYDCSGNVYQAVGGQKLNNCAFVFNTSNCSDSFYLQECRQTQNSFGCVGLRNKEYCILNKQYSAEEYQVLVKKVVAHMKSTGEWGRFFPLSHSPFGYNETEAQLHFPLTQQSVQKIGGWWETYRKPSPAGKSLEARTIPDHIQDIDDSFAGSIIKCEASGEAFRVSKAELELYRRFELPVPRRHPNQRYLDMLRLRNSPVLYKRSCQKCGGKTLSTFAPDRPEIIHCEVCFHMGSLS